MPCNHIQRRVVQLRDPKLTQEFTDQFVVAVEVFITRVRGMEIPRVGKPVGADGPEVRQLERGAEILTNIAASAASRQIDPEAQAARDDGDFLRLDMNSSEFRVERQRSKLRHDEHLAIRTVEKPPPHRLICGIQVNGAARLKLR